MRIVSFGQRDLNFGVRGVHSCSRIAWFTGAEGLGGWVCRHGHRGL